MASGLIEIEQAQREVLAAARPLEAEPVDLKSAWGRVLARDIEASEQVPPFDNSAMDGFAVRAEDLPGASEKSPVRLSVVGEARAGHPASSSLRTGQAIAISTGAMLPAGADSVVMVERTRSESGYVEVFAATLSGQNVRYAGQDIAAGSVPLARGATLGAAELGVLASLGCDAPPCTRRASVTILTTGDELVDPSTPLRPGLVRNSNLHTIAALTRDAGGELLRTDTVGDDRAATKRAIGQALQADVAVICGGMSVGAHDHVRAGLAELGVHERFFGVALKPGKPTWFGTLGNTLVFGLPGNPVSAMVTFILFVRPALRALSGAAEHTPLITATLLSDYEKAPGRAHAVRCRLTAGANGWEARPTGEQGSHILTSMLGANALAIIPSASGSVAAGETVEAMLLSEGRGVTP
ncbi:MAG TPA: gephyrin-like molybdotransferase Glp [Solirubrobacteraceae bacterium]|jgi:molybdopterin molybdotransferase